MLRKALWSNLTCHSTLFREEGSKILVVTTQESGHSVNFGQIPAGERDFYVL